MEFCTDNHMAAVQRANAVPQRPHTHEPTRPWTPSVPQLSPWRERYLGLDEASQQRWDSLSLRQRAQVFGL